MEFDRPHYRATTPTTTSSSTGAAANSSEILICLASRLPSSSSMKLSKSILSPGRAARDAPVSLPTSLSRRLRTNGSLKGGASPFFTTAGKKRGCGFENPEPSSPKVTCIGQVRVKTKKKVKQTRSLSRRRSGDISFRKLGQGVDRVQPKDDKICSQTQRFSNVSSNQEQQRNQRWVHLPVTICEALRSFGAEFSCLFPRKSSCFSTSERDKRSGSSRNEQENAPGSCGAVFARWLVSVNDDGGGKRKEIELVVGGGDEEEMRRDLKERMMSIRSSRRHVLEDIEIKDDKIEVKGQSVEGEEEEKRVSVCIPPKNALLLMRCRSDPMKMAALANRFSLDANAAADDDDEHVNEDREDNDQENEDIECEVENVIAKQSAVGTSVEEEIPAESEALVPENGERKEAELQKMDELLCETEQEEETEVKEEEILMEEEVESNMSSFEALVDQENAVHYEEGEEYDSRIPQEDEEMEQNSLNSNSSPSTQSDEEQEEDEDSGSTEGSTLSEEAVMEKLEETQEKPPKDEEEYQQSLAKEKEENQEAPALPECLLLMMCEPKLSMEVSKETWVCRTNFLRWIPERHLRAVNQKPTKKGCDQESIKKKVTLPDSKPKPISFPPEKHLQQPPRSSCSLPTAAASMATMIEQKLVNTVGHEPFVLTRCMSEPMRTAAAKLLPESCLWKNAMTKLEPHRRATFGVGAAGVGF